jgi:hypothetical protein
MNSWWFAIHRKKDGFYFSDYRLPERKIESVPGGSKEQ